MFKSKWFYICLIVLSGIVIVLSVLPVIMSPAGEAGTESPAGIPPMAKMPAGGLPPVPETTERVEVQQFMEEVQKNGGLTPELEKQAKEMGIPDQMLEMAGTAAPPKGLNIVLSGAMIMGTIVIGFSSFRLYKLKKHR
ncbi:hypothetical protein [Peribacillus frigoritolerans]|uniref:hypothetical protein n=1 Tax=Peribacillus frigoritolerans TaxID=450367 RepID=UPI0010596A9F|nr:hypothetical protein [Peribacillus frigoritolerans]TDL82777.1 hypothetical protein E2R53_04220 [Peribacillus frigoritolerans]